MSGKTYKCPFCNERATREDLGQHIEEEHDECIPKGMTANQIVFNTINHKDHGTCVVCKRPTKWNETACKYDRLCGRPQCQKALRDAYKKNMLRVHGKTTLLDDPEQQEKMLANRRISGKYKFTDGGYHVFTGKYEEKALEFMDKVMGFKSTDILSPGPTIEYIYKGKKLKWITDILLIPFNLVIEVKDGGSNPNNREMVSYREKQLAKEQMITNMGKFNYLRLTDNDFSQLLGIVAELKAQMIDDSEENKKVIINVNEEVNMLQEKSLPLFFSEEDKCYNVDKWIDGKIDTLFICGMSGGGKSTTANIFADKYNGTVISLDAIYIYMLQMPSLRKKLLQYKNELKYIALFSKEEYGSETGILYSDDDKDEKGVKFIKFCSRYIKRPIFEGVQVARIYFKDNSIFEDAAILIKGTSTVTSLLRRVKRDKSGLSDIVYYMKSYYKHYKQQSKFMDSLDNDMLQETCIDETVGSKFTKRYSGFNDLCKSIKTPSELNDWYNVNNIRWFTQDERVKRRLAIHSTNENDVIVAWPDEIIKNHAGICFDHAIFMRLLCNRNSIENRMLYIGTIATNDKDTKYLGHIVCLYKIKDSGVYIFNYRANNEGSLQGPFGSYEEAEAAYKKYYFYITSLFLKLMPGKYHAKKVFSRTQKENLNVYDDYYNDRYATQAEIIKRIPEIWDMFAKVNKECHTDKITWLDEVLSKLDKIKLSSILKSIKGIFGESTINESGIDRYKKKYTSFDAFCKDMQSPTDVLNWVKVNQCDWPKEFNAKDRSKGIHFYWPDDILRTKLGTCIDFTLLMHFFCERKHIENYILRTSKYFRKYGDKEYHMFQHFMCIYKEKDGLYYVFNYQGKRSYGMRGPYSKPEDVRNEQLKMMKKHVMSVKNIIGKASDNDLCDIKYFAAIQDTKEYPIYDKFYGDKKIFRDDMMFKSKYMPSLICKYDSPNPEMHNDMYDNLKEKLTHLPKSIKAKLIYAASDWFNRTNDSMMESGELDDSVYTYEGEYHSTDPNYESLIESVGVEHKERINYFISPKTEGAEILLANLACAGKDRFKEWFDPSEKFFSIIGKATASFYEKAGKEYEFLIIFNPKDTDANKRYNANQLCNYIQSMATGNGLIDTMKDKLFTFSGIMHIKMAKDLWLSYLILFGEDEIEKIFLVAYNMDTEWMELIPMPVPPMNTYRDSIAMEANLVPIPKPKDIKYIQSGEGIMNPYIVYDGKQYRVRVETLVFNKQGDVLIEMQDPKNLNKYGTNYKLPGGGLDKGKSLDEQAEAECNEEALVVTKNMSYTGMTYFQSYDGKYPEWQKKKLWPLGLKYEGSLTFIFVAEYVKKYTGHIDDVDKDDFYQKAKYVGVDTIDWRAEHEEAIDFYFNHRDAIREGADMDLNEFAGPGGMTPAPDLSYVTQYGPVHRDTGTGIMDMNVEGYAVSNDILTKNILTQDKSGMVKKENTEEFLKGRKLRVFQFRSDPEGLRIIENAIGTVQPRGFIYEALTGKKLLSDDQILCDEACTEISPVDIGSEATSYLQTVAEQLKSIKGKKDHEFPLTNPRMIKEADAITEGLKDVVVMENQYGVYAKNAKTGMRTAYYQRIKDIPAKVVAKKNVKH